MWVVFYFDYQKKLIWFQGMFLLWDRIKQWQTSLQVEWSGLSLVGEIWVVVQTEYFCGVVVFTTLLDTTTTTNLEIWLSHTSNIFMPPQIGGGGLFLSCQCHKSNIQNTVGANNYEEQPLLKIKHVSHRKFSDAVNCSSVMTFTKKICPFTLIVLC